MHAFPKDQLPVTARLNNVVEPPPTPPSMGELQQWTMSSHSASKGIALYNWFVRNPGRISVAAATLGAGISKQAFYDMLEWLEAQGLIEAHAEGTVRLIRLQSLPAVPNCDDRVRCPTIGLTVLRLPGIDGSKCPNEPSHEELRLLDERLEGAGVSTKRVSIARRAYVVLRGMPVGTNVHRYELAQNYGSFAQGLATLERLKAIRIVKQIDEYVAVFPIVADMTKFSAEQIKQFLWDADAWVRNYANSGAAPASRARFLQRMVRAIQEFKGSQGSGESGKELIALHRMLKDISFDLLRAQLVVFFMNPATFEDDLNWKDKAFSITTFQRNHQVIADQCKEIASAYAKGSDDWWKKRMVKAGLEHWCAAPDELEQPLFEQARTGHSHER
jgi:hypothetical protein